MKNINIKLTQELVDKFFCGMDSDCLEQVKDLAQQGAVINPTTGEIVLNNIRTNIFTDYFVGGYDAKKWLQINIKNTFYKIYKTYI